jgi:hypothetical protein
MQVHQEHQTFPALALSNKILVGKRMQIHASDERTNELRANDLIKPASKN